MTAKVNKMPKAKTPGEMLAANVALRIASLRKSHGLSFDALAQQSGVSKGTLVQIEQQRANPSIATLCRLATALGVSVADLVAATETVGSKVTVMDRRAARILWHGPKGGTATLLGGTAGADMLELWHWELKPGEHYEARAHSRGTREIIHVSCGRLRIVAGGMEYLVTTGQTAVAETDVPHVYANSGKTPVRFTMTVHEPGSAP